MDVDFTLHAQRVSGMEMPAVGILHVRLAPEQAVFYVNEQHPLAQAIDDALAESARLSEQERGQEFAGWVLSRLDRLVEHGPELDRWGVFRDDVGPFYQLSVRRFPRPASA